MCIYDKFCLLCENKGVKPTRAALEAGISKSLLNKWKETPDAIPNGETLIKMARYFNVTVDEVLCLENEKDPADENISRINEELFMKYAESLSRSDALELAQKLIALAANQE